MKHTTTLASAMAAACLSLSNVSNADVIALKAAYYTNLNNNGDTITLAIEHPLPVIPNIRVASVSSSPISFDVQQLDTLFSINANLERQDLTGYYEILNNGLAHLDIGLGLTNMSLDSVNLGLVELEDDSEIGGHLYTKLRMPFGESGLGLYAEATAGQAMGIGFIDAHAGLTYTVSLAALDLRIYGGYSIMEYDDLPSFGETIEDKGSTRFGFEIDL